jgi:hypothetical protein
MRPLDSSSLDPLEQAMSHFARPSVFVPSVLGLLLFVGAGGAAQAGEARSFVIAANDGYGLNDCLGEGGECGRAVADAWCAANGRGAALAFGPARDANSAAKGAFVVTCGD